ncbi:MAG: hypothetical protein KF760_06655 [Candidatus Eremiobacteraeota bacterium]|nr:hypothetical protein [Candidatus Eremiobacteraeota bacterium]MCW5866062.1 hypothetical protein [Candidatus Eremiobacteraeota bacterium]
MRILICFFVLAGCAWAAPWGAAGVARPPMRSMPQMRILNADSPGQPLDLKAELTAGKFNVVDFYADW